MGSDHKIRWNDVLRSKNFMILVLFIVATSISIWLLSVPTPNIRTIMTQTHKQIESQIENLKNMQQEMMKPERRPESPDVNGQELTLDETYLELLGFGKNPKLYPLSHQNSRSPVIVTGANNQNLRRTIKLVNSVKKYLKDKKVAIFDLGMGSYELVTLKKHCNETFNCSVKSLDFDKFPKHLRDMEIKAYLPVAIQEALTEYGAIFWTTSDVESYFISKKIEPLLAQSKKTGFVAWTIESMDSTSALTHPKMFDYFDTSQQNYWFHRMVSTDHLIIYNTERTHNQIMRHWVQCALTINCIYPKGAQSVGCNNNRRPKYKYSGCHKFEVSALNVILGMVFGDINSEYITHEQLFGVEVEQVTHPDNITHKVTTEHKKAL